MAIRGEESLLHVADFIPKLLGTFHGLLYHSYMPGQALDRDKGRSDRIVRLKNFSILYLIDQLTFSSSG